MQYIKMFRILNVVFILLLGVVACREESTYDYDNKPNNNPNNKSSDTLTITKSLPTNSENNNNNNISNGNSSNAHDNTSNLANNYLKELISVNSKISQVINTIAVDYIDSNSSFGDKLYIGGEFSIANGSQFNHIAYWNTKNWEDLNGGVNGNVYTITIDNDYVYVGGSFTEAGHIPVNNIARWSKVNKEWEKLQAGLGQNGDVVYALVIYNGNLYAGGKFSASGSKALWNVAMWNGDEWTPVANGLNDTVRSMAVFNNQLYVGGDFTRCAYYNCGGYIWQNLPFTTGRSHIAVWDGIRWENVIGGGTNGSVYTLYANDVLYVGGKFSTAGNLNINNIAIWDPSFLWSNISIYYPNNKVLSVVDVIEPVSGAKHIAIGGSFNKIGILNINRLGFFNTSIQQWFTVNPFINCDVLEDVCEIRALTKSLDNKRFYIGGVFNIGQDFNKLFFAIIESKSLKLEVLDK